MSSIVDVALAAQRAIDDKAGHLMDLNDQVGDRLDVHMQMLRGLEETDDRQYDALTALEARMLDLEQQNAVLREQIMTIARYIDQRGTL